MTTSSPLHRDVSQHPPLAGPTLGGSLGLASILHGLLELDDLDARPSRSLVALGLHQIDVSADTASRWIEVRNKDGRLLRRHDLARRLGAVRLAPDGRSLAYTVEGDGAESELRLLELDTGATRPLLVSSRLIGPPVFAPDGRRIAIAAAPDVKSEPVACKVGPPLENEGLPPGETTLVVLSVDGGAAWHVPLPAVACAWHPDGRSLVLVVPRLRSGLPTSELYCVREGAAPERLETGLVWASHPAFSPSGRLLALIGTDGPVPTSDYPSMRAWVVEPGSGRPARQVSKRLLIAQRSPSADSGLTWLDNDTFVARAGQRGCIGLSRFSVHGSEEILLGGEEQVTHFGRVDGGLVYATLTPAKSWSVRRRDDTAATMTLLEPNAAFDDFLASPEATRYEVRMPTGYVVGGWILRPRSGPASRLLVSMHGGPHGFVGPGVSQTHLYRWLAASRGWTVLALDPSGSGTWGDEHLDRIRGRWGTIDLEETLAAVDALCAEGLVSAGQVAACGFSYGGFLASTALASCESFRCGVIGAPVANLQTWYASSDIGTSFLGWEFERDVPGFWQRLHDFSPVHRVGAVRVPTLVLQGTADRRCPPSQATEFWAGLQATATAPSELVLYEGGTHSFPASGRPSQRVDYHERVVAFCDRHVGAGP